MRLFTPEDIRDIYIKVYQRGFYFLLTKLSVKGKSRTISSFNSLNINSSNWWIIPQVKERWNYLISGDPNVNYETFVSEKYFNRGQKIRMLSIGSGVCSHEIEFARINPNWEVWCIDFSNKLLNKAAENARCMQVNNIYFLNEDIYTFKPAQEKFDLILFHSSLHHFKNMHQFMNNVVVNNLVAGGKLLINEYVGAKRLQYSRTQHKAINKGLKKIPSSHKKIYKTNLTKRRYYGSGVIRMMLADPSECIESDLILPSIANRFSVIFEKKYGGNLLMPVLKDISHHFIEPSIESEQYLNQLFVLEDEYLQSNPSDFIVGLYQLN